MNLLPLVEQQMSASPTSIAVVCQGRRVTYGQLRGEMARIARGLRDLGVEAGSLVGVFLNRSPEMIAALLGIWQAGAAYLPLDPTLPSERVSFMLEDSGVPVVLSDTELLGSLPAGIARVVDLRTFAANPSSVVEEPASLPAEDSLAYVIYTSGSTGRPKGAKISHGGLTNTILALQKELQLGKRDVMLATSTVAFDISNLQFYLPLIGGACVHIAEREIAADGARLLAVLRDAGITVMTGMATSYRLLLEAGWEGDPNLQLTIGGEPLSLDLARNLAKRTRAFWNHYGPTEASICATSEKIEPGLSKVTVGPAIDNVRVYVLDADLRPAAPGVMGEIYIGGAGVGLGYLNRPELTNASFLPDPFAPEPGARMYKTGDLGALLPGGKLDFMGRADEQVKIRGFRIELEEVEATLCDCDGVQSAVVRAIEFSPDDKRLIAFVIAGASVDSDQLRKLLRRRLPDYMVPSEYIRLESFPVTPSGKIDRRALDIMRLEPVVHSASLPIGDELESKLVEIWKKIFKIGNVKVSDNFFDLGGHSLLAVQMLAQTGKQFGTQVPLSILVERPTIERLADYIRRHSEGEPPYLVTIQLGGERKPVFFAHGIGGSLLTFRHLAAQLGPEQPVYGLQLPASIDIGAAPEQDLIQTMAAKYIEQMRTVAPSGPYQLVGHSSGALIVFEMAKQLLRQGLEISLLGLLDGETHVGIARQSPWQSWSSLKAYIKRYKDEVTLIPGFGVTELLRTRLLYRRQKAQRWVLGRFPDFARRFPHLILPESRFELAATNYVFEPYPGDAVLFVAEDEPRSDEDPSLGWRSKILGRLEIITTPGTHQTIFVQPNVLMLARKLSSQLDPKTGPPAGIPSAQPRPNETDDLMLQYLGASSERA